MYAPFSEADGMEKTLSGIDPKSLLTKSLLKQYHF